MRRCTSNGHGRRDLKQGTTRFLTGGALIAACGLAAAACGSAAAGRRRARQRDHLRVHHIGRGGVADDHADRRVRRYREALDLRCRPAGGSFPYPATACAKLTKLPTIFAASPRHVMCPMIMADARTYLGVRDVPGPKVHHLIADGGCTLARWSAAEPDLQLRARYFSSRDIRRSASGLAAGLARRAVRSAESARDLADRVAAHRARLADLAVHPQARLLLFFQVAGGQSVRPPDGLAQRAHDHRVQRLDLLGGQTRREPERGPLRGVRHPRPSKLAAISAMSLWSRSTPLIWVRRPARIAPSAAGVKSRSSGSGPSAATPGMASMSVTRYTASRLRVPASVRSNPDPSVNRSRKASVFRLAAAAAPAVLASAARPSARWVTRCSGAPPSAGVAVRSRNLPRRAVPEIGAHREAPAAAGHRSSVPRTRRRRPESMTRPTARSRRSAASASTSGSSGTVSIVPARPAGSARNAAAGPVSRSPAGRGDSPLWPAGAEHEQELRLPGQPLRMLVGQDAAAARGGDRGPGGPDRRTPRPPRGRPASSTDPRRPAGRG